MDNEKKPSTNILTIGLDSSQYASSSSFSPVEMLNSFAISLSIYMPIEFSSELDVAFSKFINSSLSASSKNEK